MREKEIIYPDFFEMFEKVGIETIHFPIVDKMITVEMRAFWELGVRVARIVEGGGRVHVHCRGGKGRTGMLVFVVMQVLGVGLFRGAAVLRYGLCVGC